METLFGIDRRRPLPVFTRRSFMKRFREIKRPVENPSSRVALFVDFHANYCQPELAVKVVEVLQSIGVEVDVPRQATSGYPFIGYGNLKDARKHAEKNVKAFYPYVEKGYDVISLEPTATYTLRYSYPKLLAYDEEAVKVAEKTYELFEYLSGPVEERLLNVSTGFKGRAALHIPCHQRMMSPGKHLHDLLRKAGVQAEVVETGMCCGMAGTFGLKKGPIGYELSMAIGSRLFKLMKESGAELIITESSVCKMQLEQGTGMRVLHPLEVLDFTPNIDMRRKA